MDCIEKLITKKISHYRVDRTSSIVFYKTNKLFNLKNIQNSIDAFVNLELVNNIRRINKFHEAVNRKLKDGDFYIIASETLEERRTRVYKKAPYGFRFIVRLIDFIYKRVFPKIPYLNKIYFSITNGNNRVLSKAEILGRIIACGFEIIEYFEYENNLYIISKKYKAPDYNMSPSYSPIFKMNRVGYKGQVIGVYKLRTMYPFSEYLQDLIIKENKLAKSGKISNDYRVTTWGRFCRRFWIDEIPMIINFFKRQLNIVGVRPLSKGYFNKYPIHLQDLRIKVKPGLIPPYYVDLPNSFDEILKSEEVYIKKKLLKPFHTDLKYFMYALYNIIIKGARSN